MDNNPEREKLDAMATRIRQAEAKPKVEAQSGNAVPMKVSRIGFDFMGTVIACTLLGWLADKAFGIKPWGVLAMTLMGFAVGTTNLWRALGRPKSE
jgi:F0F1-type ATP synthase assembly protein I